MLCLSNAGLPLCDGISRRDWLRVGSLGLGGLTLPQLLRAREANPPAGWSGSFGKAKSCIIFGLVGGPPQQETWDPKPEAPMEIRGPIGTIASRVPGLNVGELMPQTAMLADKCAVLRAVVTGDNAHSSSGYYMLTGQPHIPPNIENSRPAAPNNWPNVGSLVKTVLPQRPGLPPVITLPDHLWNNGNIPWPGQDGGFLGRVADPWFMHCDPSSPQFQVPALTLPAELSSQRFDSRMRLLEGLNRDLDRWGQSTSTYDLHSRQALDMLTAAAARKAFRLEDEPAAVRDRYGWSQFAQSALLSRRLVEAGVSLVQINWTRIENKLNFGGWDTHEKHVEAMRDFLMPMMDQSFSALLEDLDARGLLDETLVVWFGEFGRTPRFNGNAGRDHWGSCFSIAMAGGGIRGGVVHGVSDGQAAYPVAGKVLPEDIHATIFHCLGFHPETLYHDPNGRPLPLSRGQVIEAIT